jgi:hypothetical protein
MLSRSWEVSFVFVREETRHSLIATYPANGLPEKGKGADVRISI